MRWLAALAALAFAVPAAAQDDPAWAGVWEGKVGNSPVRLCVDVWPGGPARGAYYYLSALEPIQLSDYDGEGGWIEQAAGNDATALWEFTEQTGTRLRGTWRQDRRSLPFDLRPVTWTEGEWGGPCSSAAFLEPRVRPAAFAIEPATKDGWAYVRHLYRPPAHFREETSIEAFSFAPQQPGDAAINATLTAYRPRGAVGDEFLQCHAGQIASIGYDGFFDQLVEPRLVSRAFLTVAEHNDQSCGGTHPNTWTVYRTFDRDTGRPIDLYDWIGDPLGPDEARPLPTRLRDAVLASWPNDSDEGAQECRDVVASTDFWTLELARDGISFSPDLPRVVMACGDTVLLTWKDLDPYLDSEGRAGLARLRGD